MAGIAHAPARQRATKRTRVLVAGMLFTPDGAQRVLIRDLSHSGALIAVESEVAANCDAIFKRGNLFAAVRVAWSSGQEAGLRFYRELTPGEVDSTLVPLVR